MEAQHGHTAQPIAGGGNCDRPHLWAPRAGGAIEKSGAGRHALASGPHPERSRSSCHRAARGAYNPKIGNDFRRLRKFPGPRKVSASDVSHQEAGEPVSERDSVARTKLDFVHFP